MKHFLIAALLSASATAALATPTTSFESSAAPKAPVAQAAEGLQTAWIQPYLPPIMRRLNGPWCSGPLCLRK